eukprot:CAMPEP_0172609444 /NCGR_PEP_ID=MMETSP1068-20121228/29444_1 /TAXON_ID=35684 /ORGANISM="Pseudopedinella elastica, Strain CCMP716" /LENGTH=153 /DNA_ID=CAMNT_0013412961 /DNA_START=28 /DNA_END=485 /DNA_ORIENTATION=-
MSGSISFDVFPPHLHGAPPLVVASVHGLDDLDRPEANPGVCTDKHRLAAATPHKRLEALGPDSLVVAVLKGEGRAEDLRLSPRVTSPQLETTRMRVVVGAPEEQRPLRSEDLGLNHLPNVLPALLGFCVLASGDGGAAAQGHRTQLLLLLLLL